jgi:hypothetical protein
MTYQFTQLTDYTTSDTGETVRFRAPHPRDDDGGYALDGYDWMDAAATTGWHVMANWGKDGWDCGQWPYVILTLARGKDEKGFFFGVTTYCEGDLTTKFFRSQERQWAYITEWCRWNWEHGQGDGPRFSTPIESTAEREVYGRPFGDEYDGKVTAMIEGVGTPTPPAKESNQ